jgi:hypothetical protein
MNLFDYRNWKLEVKPEAFTIKAFKVLMDRDKSKDKNIGLKELAFVYHMADTLSPFSSYLDEESKSRDIKTKVGLSDKWNADEKIKEAIEVYKELDETITSRYLDSVKIALSKIDKFFRDYSVDDDTETSDIKRIDDMIRSSIGTVKSLRELEKLVLQDKEVEGNLKGNRKKPLFTDDE